ncbi:MAG: hypothetical protein IPH07_34725 [Deltaproteobacteria bacterium]|nr:hypothetical protein [Deltaproteobacteria bacterium]MBK8716345.1 hypothetical protein [Deltaproteobacteria bacterium]MBP7287935.1 hypothetical protein [Nannocystaceae bacterium]
MPKLAFRGAVCHGVLTALERLPHGAAVLAAVAPEAVERIRRSGKLAWIPSDALVSINCAHLEIAGTEQYLDFWRRYVVGSVDNSLYSALFDGALRIFGRNPNGLLKWLGRSWELSSRGLGTVEVVPGVNECQIVVTEIPEVHRLVAIALSTQGSVMGVLDVARHPGEVTIDLAKLAQGSYTAVARWREPLARDRGPEP